VKLAGVGVNQTKVVAGPAYVGSCVLTRDLVAALLKRKEYEPPGLAELLSAHEEATSVSHDLASLATQRSVQKLLSAERHEALFQKLRARSSIRSSNLMLACSMPHSSDWLLAPPIAGLGLALQSAQFRAALKFRLSMPLYSEAFPCPALTKAGKVCGAEMDQFGDHAICCRHGTSLLFRHNNVRDILGHAAKAAGLSAVVTEKKYQIEGSNEKPGDITVQQYHRGFALSAFDVTISHPLQIKYIEVAMEEAGVAAQDAHDKKLQKSLAICDKEGLHFVPLAWESLGGATETVHDTLGRWTDLEGARGGYPAYLIRRNLYAQISCCLQRHLAQAVIDRRLELSCDRVL
jgi:hypothetical protein